jgi:hypothetical protein
MIIPHKNQCNANEFSTILSVFYYRLRQCRQNLILRNVTLHAHLCLEGLVSIISLGGPITEVTPLRKGVEYGILLSERAACITS